MSKTVTKRRHYSDSFKMQVVQEALEPNVNKRALCRKYSISESSLLFQWIRIFAPKPKLEEACMKSKSPISKDSEVIKELKRQNQQLRLDLEREKMRADLNNEIINVAEEMFNIPIRKKAGTKR